MIQTAIWIPPSLCGCQLRMMADFTDSSVVDGISYRHPIPFTITDIQLVNICAKHKPNTLAMPSISGLMETDKITGLPFQRRGYLKHPIVNPTPAQCLYTFLSQYSGGLHRHSCGCQSFWFGDEGVGKDKKVIHLDHPRYTSQKCLVHKADDINMTKAQADYNAQQAAVKVSGV